MRTELPESTLIERSLTGDANAFGELVTQHQSLICALAYSLCGNIERSQELAQETFVAAWKNLRSLQDRSKFKPWLCGIARNLARSAYRSDQRDAMARSNSLDSMEDPRSQEPEPDADAMDADDRALVWNALAQMPEIYREPLVLYYREEESVRRVAAALDLSEDAVKQRLSRGRGLLKERVATLVEGTLARSRPGPVFTTAVLASLPALFPPTASAAVVATSAKGTSAAASVGWLGAIFGPLLGLWGAWFGYQASLKATLSEPERREVKRMMGLLIALITLFGMVLGWAAWSMTQGEASDPRAFAWRIIAIVIGYVLLLVSLIIFGNRRLHRVRQEHAVVPERPMVEVPLPRQHASKTRFLGLPLLHVTSGSIKDGVHQRGVAKGWIAMGDIAISPFLAFGSVAIGPIAFGAFPLGLIAIGGIAVGGLAFGGLALGLMSIGGLAIGWWALGGVAVGVEAAQGGVAMARDFALGAPGVAAQANNAAAQAWFATHPVFGELSQWSRILPWLAPIVLVGFGLFIYAKQTLRREIGERMQTIRSGWIAECQTCGYAEPLGGLRLKATSYQKRKLGYCRGCKRLRIVAIRHLEGDEANTPTDELV